MGPIMRGAFAVLVLATVLSTLFVTWYAPAQATETPAPEVRQALVMARATQEPTPSPEVTSSSEMTSGSEAFVLDPGPEPEPEPVVTVTVTITPSPSPSVPPSQRPGKVRVGYLAQRGPFGGTSTVKTLDTSGEIAWLTHVNYAFANIDPDTLTCASGVTRPPSSDPGDPDQGDGAGDAWADYQRGFTAAESVDGVPDAPDAALAGNFNQLKKLKARHPGLKTLISIGGWTYSKYFSDVARTAASRQKFVKSCVDTYIRGDLPVAGGRGGPGSARGVFDGIDIDWEWPGAQGHVGNHVTGEDKDNLTALLAEFRAQLDALGRAMGRRYLLTAYLPDDPEKIHAGWDLDRIYDSLDFSSIKGRGAHAVGGGSVLL
ncbi:glycoside hydrolase family 18 protein [Planotetraspora sp. GP83]|uniref:glycoside hydrolase family 18 protein n=1 Tax=Planotetraspora sp. GP83 TaxID=3156264 RepID=UPI0035154B5E